MKSNDWSKMGKVGLSLSIVTPKCTYHLSISLCIPFFHNYDKPKEEGCITILSPFISLSATIKTKNFHERDLEILLNRIRHALDCKNPKMFLFLHTQCETGHKTRYSYHNQYKDMRGQHTTP